MSHTFEKLDDYHDRFARLIELEAEAERERLAARASRRNSADAERSGETLLDLVITEYDVGLGGRTLAQFVKRNRTLPLPWNRLRVGSPVVVTSQDEEASSAQGIVSSRKRASIEVALEAHLDGEHFRIDLSPDEVTRKRQLAALNSVRNGRERTRELARIIVHGKPPSFHENSTDDAQNDTSPLNSSQQRAVEFALASRDLAIIHGPPGTGKTTTVVEFIRRTVARGERVLACAPSNTAVDNLLEKLVANGLKVVRIGHPARVTEQLRDYTLDALAERHDAMKIVKDMLREAEGLFRKAGRYTRAKPTRGARQEMRREARQLKADARLLEQQAVHSVLEGADVVCATSTFDEDLFRRVRFDVAVIDEACQATEPGCWIPILQSNRVVLAGDHCQLPPTVLSAEAAKQGLDRSMLERLMLHHGDTVARQLQVQYRMHERIMQFSSAQFYDDSLVADQSVVSHLLHDLAPIQESPLTAEPASFYDTAGSGWEEEIEPDGESKRNPEEGGFVLRKLQQLLDARLRPSGIAVIAPYAAQVRWLRENWTGPDVEIDTVDGFQGREKEAVLISCVRSNGEAEIGFLADRRRMNVALTRARRKLIVVGDSATLGANDFFGKLLEYFDTIGGYHTVWEESRE